MKQLSSVSGMFSSPHAAWRATNWGRSIIVGLLEDPPVQKLIWNKVFWSVLVLKFLLGTLFASYFMRDLFVPFLNYFVSSGFSNPWTQFFELGRLNSFPYPPIMLYIMAVPRWLFGPILSGGTDTVTVGHLLVMRLPLLVADLSIALALVRWFPNRVQRILFLYWASPFVIYVSYWHGQLDIIPTALFVWCLYLLRLRHFGLGMVAFAIGVATKSHLLIALPFLLVYIHQERGLVATTRTAIVGSIVYALALLPFLPDPAFREMVYRTEEQYRLFAFEIAVGSSGLGVLIAVAAIILIWLRFATYAKRNWDLFMLYLGIIFAVFMLLAPPAQGYVIWSLPFLIHFMCRTPNIIKLPYVAYVTAYFAFFWLGSQSDLLDAWRIISPQIADWQTPHELLSSLISSDVVSIDNLTFTFMQASLASVVVSMYVIGVRSNAVYKMRTTPITIGLAGDSGSGKATFAELVTHILGKDRVTVIAGDDYHRWPRGHEMWQVYTHLNAETSDLYQQHDDAIALSAGRSIMKGTYDHETGQFTERQVVDPSQFVIFKGLHTLSTDGMRRLFDLKVFVDPDEDLRRLWKVRRDSNERGYTLHQVIKAIEDRQEDRERYILPQRDQAELLIRWVPKEDVNWRQTDLDPQLELHVTGLNTFNFTGLVQGLNSLSTTEVDHEPYTDTRWQSLHVRGTATANQIEALSNDLIPNLDEITPAPAFAPDLPGCAQLAFLICLSDKLRWSSHIE